MELFERVRIIASQVANSQAALAKRLGLPQNTFQGYLKQSRQDNLWPLLTTILDLYPQISREWLYFGEGEMLVGEGCLPKEESKPHTPSKIAAHPNDESLRIHALETEVIRLQGELIDAKDEIIALQKKMMCQLPAWEVHGEASENFNGSPQLPVKTAAGTHNVARLQPAKND